MNTQITLITHPSGASAPNLMRRLIDNMFKYNKIAAVLAQLGD